MLFNRYANPMTLLDQMIRAGRFGEFISGFMEAIDREASWQFYLAKVEEDISFEEYIGRMKRQTTPPEPVIKNDIETTVKQSMEILNQFGS